MATTTHLPAAAPAGPPRPAATPPQRLPWTGNDQADRLIAGDPTALLIGFLLDQQITVQKAFTGPLDIRARLGTLDAGELARMDPADVEAAFSRPPAIHRFPRSMAQRVQALCSMIAGEYGGDASRVWNDAADADDLLRRLGRLPGFGPMKARTVLTLLVKQFGVTPAGYEQHLPDHPTLGDVTTPEELNAYQTGKRAHKAMLRAQGLAPRRPGRGLSSPHEPRTRQPTPRIPHPTPDSPRR